MVWNVKCQYKDSCIHNSLLTHEHTHTHTNTRNQADTSPAIPLLSLPSVSVFFPFSSSEWGQLENILCSFSTQTRDSQGPLIKDKPSSSLSASFLLILSFSLLRQLSSSSLHCALSLTLLPLSFSLLSNLFPSFPSSLPLSQLSPEPAISRSLRLFVMVEV